MDTDSLYIALFGHDLYDCIRQAKKKEWNSLRSGDCTDEVSADSNTNLFPRTCCAKHKKYNRRQPGLFKKEIRCKEMICLCSKAYCCYDSQSKKFKYSSKGLNKRTLEDSSEAPMSKYWKALAEHTDVTSQHRGCRTIQQAIAIYEQRSKGLSHFHAKRNVQQDGIHTRRLSI